MIRPLTLNEGKDYFFRVHQDNGHNPVYLPVRFISYQPCPELVVIGDGNGQQGKVPRDDLFIPDMKRYFGLNISSAICFVV
jgi:hypothetical protein